MGVAEEDQIEAGRERRVKRTGGPCVTRGVGGNRGEIPVRARARCRRLIRLRGRPRRLLALSGSQSLPSTAFSRAPLRPRRMALRRARAASLSARTPLPFQIQDRRSFPVLVAPPHRQPDHI